MATWVGIDISKDTADIGWYEGNIKKHFKVANNEEGFKKTVLTVPADSKFIMEATGTYHLNFALHLAEIGKHVSVENPIRIRNHIRTELHRSKDDKSDSLSIAKFGTEKNPSEWLPVTEESIHLQQLSSLIDTYTTQIVQLTNVIHAFSQVKFKNKLAIKMLQKSVKDLSDSKEKAETEYLNLIKKTHNDEFEIIKSIPGIGEGTAAQLITTVGNFSRFENSRKLVSFLGLSPTKKQSGTSLNKRGPISRMGGCKIRSLLYLCALSAIKYNNQCREMWVRMKAIGKPSKVVLMAIANKLIRQAYAMVTSKTLYDKNLAF